MARGMDGTGDGTHAAGATNQVARVVRLPLAVRRGQ